MTAYPIYQPNITKNSHVSTIYPYLSDELRDVNHTKYVPMEIKIHKMQQLHACN